MKINLIVSKEPEEFSKLLKAYIGKAEKEGYIIRDIKYSDNGTRYSALLLLVNIKPEKPEEKKN